MEEKGYEYLFAQDIMEILLAQPEVVMSWGFHDPEAIPFGIIFKVNGFVHRGTVKIIYDEGMDVFRVWTCNMEGEEIQVEDYVYVDQLLDVVDHMVEMCEGYRERVMEEYGL